MWNVEGIWKGVPLLRTLGRIHANPGLISVLLIMCANSRTYRQSCLNQRTFQCTCANHRTYHGSPNCACQFQDFISVLLSTRANYRTYHRSCLNQRTFQSMHANHGRTYHRVASSMASVPQESCRLPNTSAIPESQLGS